MQAGAYYYCLLSPEKLLPADITILKGWWMICCLHGQKELLAGREIIDGGPFPWWWQERMSRTKKFIFLSCFWRIYGSDRFLGFLKSQDPEELFVSREDVFVEGTFIKAGWLVWGVTIQVVWWGRSPGQMSRYFTFSLSLKAWKKFYYWFLYSQNVSFCVTCYYKFVLT